METEDKRKSRSATYYDVFLKLAALVIVALAVSSFVIATLAYVNVRDLESRVNSLTSAPPPGQEIRAKRDDDDSRSLWNYYKGKCSQIHYGRCTNRNVAIHKL